MLNPTRFLGLSIVASMLVLPGCPSDDVTAADGTDTDSSTSGDEGPMTTMTTTPMTTVADSTGMTMGNDSSSGGDSSSTGVDDTTSVGEESTTASDESSSGGGSSTTSSEMCGDDVTEGAEVCDGTDLGVADCVSEGFDAGTLACLGDCTDYDTTGCVTFACPNDITEGTEVCDGTDLNSQACTDLGFDGGTLACLADCSDYDTSGCEECGNDLIENVEVCDGADVGTQTCAGLGFNGGTLGCAVDCGAYDTSACNPFPGDCCTANGTPGCDDGQCTLDVCGIDSFCCNNSWDGICVTQANGLCTACGGGGGDCCNDEGAVGCSSPQCVAVICGQGGIDTDCCNVSWDASCTATAQANCATCLPVGTCGNDVIDDVDEECDVSDLGGESCASLGFDGGFLGCAPDCTLDSSGCFNFEGPCCAPNGTPGCFDDECTQSVCVADNSCCTSNWHSNCSNIATVFCDVCNTPDICGNGVLEAGEDCDSPDFGGADCQTEGFNAGSLACDVDCAVDNSGCFDYEGSCCSANGTPGCTDSDCVATICAVDPFCCDVAWVDFCAFEAQDQCAVCNTPDICGNGITDGTDFCDAPDVGGQTCVDEGFDGGTLGCLADCTDYDTSQCFDFGGDCCAAHMGPGCDDATCQGQVCSTDPFCCSTSWDGACANAANNICTSCGAMGGVCGNNLVDAPGEICDGPDTQGEDCESQGFDGGNLFCAFDCTALDTGGCVDFSGDCCSANGTPGCDDAACTAAICALNPFCCDVVWDSICAADADASCAVCNFDGDCCDAAGNGTPGCIDEGCTDSVCAIDPDCCDVAWDASCAATAGLVCSVCGPPAGMGDCCAANGTPGCGTSLECQFDVCNVNAMCCSGPWSGVCAMEATTNSCTGLCGLANACADEDFGTGSGTTSGTTVGAGDDYTSSCGGDNSPEWVVEYTASVSGLHVFDTIGSPFDTVLFALEDCAGAELACNDDTFGLQSQISLNLVDGQTILIAVGGFGGSQGAFTLNVAAP